MLFNELLAKQHINVGDVLVLRHTPQDHHGRLRAFLPTLAAEHPKLFNAYQRTQSTIVEGKMRRAKYVASFIGLKKQQAVFIGLYKVGNHRAVTRETFWEVPEHEELRNYGHSGFGPADNRSSVLLFDLAPQTFYDKWKGKLVIDWPAPARQFARFANKAEFPVHAILEDSLLNQAMPPLDELVVSRAEFGGLPRSWVEKLKQCRGVYYIFYPSDRKGYVGSAYGEDNLYGRWSYHVKVGGDSVQLRKRKLENFAFSILETLRLNAEQQEATEREGTWKKRLHTYSKDGGLNEN
jgi:GIY-YIG catalytic domain-containing protein